MLQISRACAAIDILDNYINGIPIEKALKEWFKNNRFAGSNDRRSIRDIIFDIIRKRLILFYPFQINDYFQNTYRFSTMSMLSFTAILDHSIVVVHS